MGSAGPGNFEPTPINEGAKWVPPPPGPWQAAQPWETKSVWPGAGCAADAVEDAASAAGAEGLAGVDAPGTAGGSGVGFAFAAVAAAGCALPGGGAESVRRNAISEPNSAGDATTGGMPPAFIFASGS